MNSDLYEPVQVDLADHQQPIALPSFAASSMRQDVNEAGTNGEGISTVSAWLGDASSESSQHGLAVNAFEGAAACADPGLAPEADAGRWGSIPNADDVPAISIGGRATNQDAHTQIATPAAGSIAIPETLASMRWINVQPAPENSHSCNMTSANAGAAPQEPPPPMLHRRDDHLAANANEANMELAEPPPSTQHGISDQSAAEETAEMPPPPAFHRRAAQLVGNSGDANEIAEPSPSLQLLHRGIGDQSAGEESTGVPLPPMFHRRADQLAASAIDAHVDIEEPPPSLKLLQRGISDQSAGKESTEVPLPPMLRGRADLLAENASEVNVEPAEPPPCMQPSTSDQSTGEESTEVPLPATLHGSADQLAEHANEANVEPAEPQPRTQSGVSDQTDGEKSTEVPLPPGPTSVPAAWLAATVAPPLPQTWLGVAAATSPSPPPPPGLESRPRAMSASSQDVDSNAGAADDAKTRAGPATALVVGNRSSAFTATPVALITAEGSDDMEPVHCKVADLWEWLKQVKLEEYYVPATRWCADMGAVSMEEIAENIVDFSNALELKPIERQRVQKWSAQVLWNSESAPAVAPVLQLEDSAPPLRAPAVATRNSMGTMSDEDDTSSAGNNPVYTGRTVRLAMDSSGSTGLDLQWNEEWGILVNGVDPLPGQPGLSAGDYIVAIDGCSLRHRSHEDCDAAFSERLQNGAALNIVSPMRSMSPLRPAMRTSGQIGQVRQPPRHAPWQIARDPLQGKGRRGGYDANRMWTRFRGPPW